MNITQDERAAAAIRYIEHFIGTWYKWGGDDPKGFDCSGLACEFLKFGGQIDRGGEHPYNAQMLYNKFPKVDIPKPGCLAFWSDNAGVKIVHVEIAINDEQTIGASGGGSKTLTAEDAMRNNAFIKERPIRRKKNFAGYVDPFAR